jgi:ADP-heptose:LPS heptosyltransferase
MPIIKDKNSYSLSYLGSLAQVNPKLNNIFILDDINRFFEFYNKKNIRVWPNKNQLNINSYSESTLSVQSMYLKHKSLEYLKMPPFVLDYAKKWIKKNIKTSLFVTVHLKNNPHNTKSNAQLKQWKIFFEHCRNSNFPIIFVLIGNDEFDEDINKLSNVIITQLHGGNLELDLALIQLSYFFMGMSSGPCNMALFSGVPYLIWKHPNHHVNEMKREFQGHDKFVFAKERYQKFFIDWDNTDNLIREFNDLYKELEKKVVSYE